MEFERIRQLLKPLFGLDHRETVARLLIYLLYTSIATDSIYIVFYLFTGGGWNDAPGLIFISLLILYFAMLFMLKKGYVDQAALILILSAWAGMTYKAWVTNGVHDTALIAYILIIIVSALITNWRISIVVSCLSILAVWLLAIAETWNWHVVYSASPASTAFELTIIFGLAVVFIALLVDALRHSVTTVQDRETRFRKIFQATPVAVMITTLREGRLLEANEAYWKLSGLNPETSIGRSVVDLHLWDNATERNEFVGRLVTQRSIRNPDHEFIDVNGARHPTSAFYELIELGDEPTILTMHYVLTEQRKAEEALRRSDERFRKVFHGSPVAIVITTLDEGRVIDANEAYWKLSGHNPQTSIGRTTMELRPGYQPEKRKQFVNELLEKKSIQDPFYDFVNDRGEHLKTVAFYELIEVEGRSAILSMFYDMTEQSAIQSALQNSETRLRALLEAIPDMIFEMKRDGTMVRFIPSSTNGPLIPPEVFLGKKIAEVLPSLAEQTHFAIERALESGQVHAFEYNLSVDGDIKVFEARITPAGNDLVLAIVRDMTLYKWAESEREKLIAELEEKNAELERFTYTASHDLKSPLITIKGFLGFVREDAKSGNIPRLEADLQRINDATEKMQRLLGDLLELSRIGRIVNKPALLDTNELVAEVIELLHGRISEGNVSIQVAENLPPVYGDRPRIHEVFQNLIDNAAKFMGDQANPRIEIGVHGEINGWPVFFVSDNGIGISPQFKDRIFGLFNKLDPKTEGTGVGLALVKRIVEYHGGRIWIESAFGKGATFFFTLQPGANSAI